MRARFAFAHMTLEEALTVVRQPTSGVTDEEAFKAWWAESQRALQTRGAPWREPRIRPLPPGHEDFVANLRKEKLAGALGARPWDVRLVDLSGVVSFQTALVEERLSIRGLSVAAPTLDAMLHICMAARSKHMVGVQPGPGNAFTLTSSNTNLRVGGQANAETEQGQMYGFVINHGLPWVQVVGFRGRYIMRDGYHRAVGLMRSGHTTIPAVVQEDVTEAELGLKPGFFSSDRIMSDQPPLVVDYLDDRLSMAIDIPRTVRVVRITADEFLVPADEPESVPKASD